jgi:hypothetical protein
MLEEIENDLTAKPQNEPNLGTSGYINLVRLFRVKGQPQNTVQLELDDDSLMLNLKMSLYDSKNNLITNKHGIRVTRNVRCLVDSGATISCFSESFVDKNESHIETFEDKTQEKVTVTFANDESAVAGKCYSGLSLYEATTRQQLAPPTLHTLPLPDGIDCILGMDWLKQFNPVINWETREVEFRKSSNAGFTPAKLCQQRTRKSAYWLKEAPSGRVSAQTMRMIQAAGGPVFLAKIRDTRLFKPPDHLFKSVDVTKGNGTEPNVETEVETDEDGTSDQDIDDTSDWSDMARAPPHVEQALAEAKVRIARAKTTEKVFRTNTKTLTKVRLEASLQDSEASLVTAADGSDAKPVKVDPRHDNGRPKLFLEQPETDHECINSAVKEAEDIHVADGLTKEQITENENNPFRAEVLQHGIDLNDGETKKPNRAYYRMSKTELNELHRQIEKYIATGMIRPSVSPYGAACLFAPKKNGKLRFCIDYRPLNNITKKNAAAQPAPDDCLNQMAGCKMFSCIDLAQGYHQIPIKEEDREKTAFNTKYGHYEWNVLPFGLTNAPATFVTALNKIFSGEAFRAGMATAKGAYAERIKQMSKQEIAEHSENLLDKFITIFVDDCIIYSKNATEHAQHLKRVFQRLREYGIYIQSSKAFYAQVEVDFLGHIVTAEGVKVQDDKVSTVREWPTPETVSHIRQFLGLSGYYRKFIKNYASIAKPMSDLTKKTTEAFAWNSQANDAFSQLKLKLTSAPVLAIPDPARGGFHLNTDACDHGIGATLSQEGEDSKLHPCAFASRVLKPSEVRAYLKTKCVYALELEALMYALDKWRFYLEGQIRTRVQTDHKSLIWLHSQTELTAAQSKFLDTLARYDLRIEYLKGELNVPGDVPSRNPNFKKLVDSYLTDAQLDDYEAMRKELEELKEKLKELVAENNKLATMSEHQARAKDKRQMRARVALVHQEIKRNERVNITFSPVSEKRKEWLDRIEKAYATDPLYKDREDSDSFKLLENHGVKLWYHVTSNDDLPPTVCIPDDAHVRELILKEFHMPPTIGHYNGEDMFTKMKRVYYWKDMRKDCLAQAKCCKICQPYKPNLRKPQGLLAEPEFPIRPWSSITLDFFGPFKYNEISGNDTILVAVCRLTKMAHFIPCSSKHKAPDIADLLMQHVIRLHGIADDYRSDRDKIFTSAVWETIWDKLGTTLSLGTAYHHQTAGQAERVNQELKRYLGIYTKSHADWEKHVYLAEYAYNSHLNASTGCTPFELNYGFRPRNPNELITPPLSEKVVESTNKRRKAGVGNAWLTQLTTLWELAQLKVRRTFTRYEKWGNKNRADAKDLFPVGSRVYLSTKNMKNLTTIGRETREGQDADVKRKLLPMYVGPYTVTEVCGRSQLNRKLALPATLKERLKHDIFHVEKLKPVGERDDPFSVTRPTPPPNDTHHPEEVFIEKIVAFEQAHNGKRYLVKWEGYPDSENKWQWEWEMENAQESIRDFFKTNPTPVNPVRRSRRGQTLMAALEPRTVFV